MCIFTLFTPFRLLNFCSKPFTWFKPFNVSLCLNQCGFITKYFQPHFALQHTPHFLHEMLFLVLHKFYSRSSIIIFLILYKLLDLSLTLRATFKGRSGSVARLGCFSRTIGLRLAILLNTHLSIQNSLESRSSFQIS